MSRSGARSRPRTLFHGSSAPLAPGDVLRPAHALGLPSRPRTLHQPHYSGLWVYLTEHPDYAQVFGTVWRVEPLGTLEPDVDAVGAWRCRRARVLKLVMVSEGGLSADRFLALARQQRAAP